MYKINVLIAFALLSIYSFSWAATFTVNSLSDSGNGACDVNECTLREAIAAANAATGADIIIFDDNTTGTITLSSQLVINFNGLQIVGPGPEKITVSGNNSSRVFLIINSDVSINGLTIANGNATNETSRAGAGIYVTNGGNAVFEDLRIINNTTTNSSGGGLNVFFAKAIIRNCEISNNTASRQSGLSVNGGDGHNVLIENVTISGNIGNQAESGLGTHTNTGQTITIRYVTVANNSGSPLGTIISGSNGITIIEGSVFADHLGANEDFLVNATNLTINNSIIESKTVSTTISGLNNIVGQDPSLLPLASVSGSIQQVHALANDSIAIDYVDITMGDAQCGTGVTTDQTGFPRPTDLSCDAGAFEFFTIEEIIFIDGFENP